MTAEDIIYHRRVRVLDYAAQVGVTAACRAFGISRTTYYRWENRARRYGLSALLPKARRKPVMPNAMTPEEVSAILAEAVANPTLGARQLAARLAARGVHRSPAGVHTVLVRRNLGTRRARVAALASITAAEQGVVTDAASEGPYGFCLTATRPGEQVCLDTFYVGRLKDVGAVWQFTAVDVATRWAVVRLISGDKNAQAAARFLRQLRAALGTVRVELTGVRTDRGPEFIGTDFTTAVRDFGIRHVLCPPRSPNHNAVVERFQGTVLHEFYRPFFHRGYVTDMATLDRALQRFTLSALFKSPHEC